jgi:hypothetical protein
MMTAYIIASGKTGIALSAISYVDYFKISCLSDEAVLKEPQVLIDLIEKNLKTCYSTDPYKSDTGGQESVESTPKKLAD